MQLLRNVALGLLVLGLTGLALLVATHEGRVAAKTVFLLPEVLPDVPARPLLLFTAEPLREEVSYPYLGGPASGTLFRSAADGPHGAVILFLGINPDLEDETLRRLAQALARGGVVVLLHHATQLQKGLASYEEVEALIGAFAFLQGRPYVDPERVGFAGFCVGSSFALVAASDPRISGRVRFVNFFGGYFSARSLLAAMTTRRVVLDGIEEPWSPNEEALTWFSQQLISSVADSEGRDLLQAALIDGRQLGTEEVARLSPQARSVYRVLVNRDPLQVGALYDALPQEVKAGFERLSPVTALDGLEANIYIMHDRNDTYIPYVESRRLAAALAAYPQKHFTEFALFQHMHPQRTLGPLDFAREVGKLYYHLYLLMLEVM